MDDIITDILARVAEALPVKNDARKFLDQIEADIRRDWGGDRPYISKSGEASEQEMTRRNAQIMRDYNSGERPAYLARKYGISRQRVHEILRIAM